MNCLPTTRVWARHASIARALRGVALLAAAGLAAGLGGCSACEGSGPAVPFGLDGGRGRPIGEPAAEREPQEDANEGPRPEGRSFPDGTERVNVEGAAIELEDSIRALWAHDLDRDGDRDVVLVAAGDASAPARVLYVQREGSRFAEPQILGRTPPVPEGCGVGEAQLSPLGDSWLLATAGLRCEERPDSGREELWVLSTDRTPRMLEHLAVLGEPQSDPPQRAMGQRATGQRAMGDVGLALEVQDHDEDGHPDLLVRVSVRREGLGETSIELPWLNRPSGLGRSTSEPESTLRQRSREALRQLRAHPARALAGSRQVLALHEVLCREGGRARLRVGRTEGLGCGSSDAAGRAATTIVRALAARGELLEALDAMDRMDRPGLTIDEERRAYARRAIAQAPATANATVREGPTHRPVDWQSARLSAVGFLDEDHVLLRGERARVWNLDSGEVEPPEGESPGELRLLDPSGRFAVAGVRRSCEGHVLQIVPASALVAGNVLGATHASPLIEPRDPPTGASCPELPETVREDDGGFEVLGWAPQGVVVRRAAELRVVPLDVSAQPAADTSVLAPGTPPPAPLPPGAIASDGRHHAEVRALGVVVHRIGASPTPTVLWPEGWAEREGAITDVAVSPSGRRVAVLRGGRVFLLERAEGAGG